MAIIIPSKKIYKKENQKVIDNIIERIEVNATKITPKNEYDVVVYGETFYSGWEVGSEKNSIVVSAHNISSGSTTTTFYDISYYSIKPTHIKNYIITIYKNEKNKNIDKLFYETDKVNIQVVSNKTTGSTKGTAYLISGSTWGMKNISVSSTTTIENVSDEIKPSWENKYRPTGTLTDVIASVPKEDTTISLQDLEDRYVITATILCGYEEKTLKGSGTEYTAVTTSGTYTKYETKKVDINFNGNTLGIDLAEETILIGNETSKKVFSVDNNELLQTTNINTSNNKSTIENEYEQTLNDFIKGKETAIINCAISDYFDDNGKLIVSEKGYNVPYTDQTPVISYTNYVVYSIITARIDNPIDNDLIITAKYGASNLSIKIQAGKTNGTLHYIILVNMPTISSVEMIIPITIPIGAIVIPQVYGQGGIDKPMSIKNGVAKQFKVIGNSIEYDGSITQQLTIQEI